MDGNINATTKVRAEGRFGSCDNILPENSTVKINGLTYDCEVRAQGNDAEIRLTDELDVEYIKVFTWEKVEEWFKGREDLAEYLVPGEEAKLLHFLLKKCLTFDQSTADSRKKVLQVSLPVRKPRPRKRKPPPGKALDSPKSSGVAQRCSRGQRLVSQKSSTAGDQRQRAMTQCQYAEYLIFRPIKINGTESTVTVLRRKKSEALAWHNENKMLSFQQTEGTYPSKSNPDENMDKPGLLFLVAWEKHKTYAHWMAWEYLVGLLRSSTLLLQPPKEIADTTLGTCASNLSDGATIKLAEAILPLLTLDRDSDDQRKRFLSHITPKQPFAKKKRQPKSKKESESTDVEPENAPSLLDIVSAGPSKDTKWNALKGGFRGNLKIKYFDALKKDGRDLLALRELGYLFYLDGDVELSAQLLHRCAQEMTAANDVQHSKVWLTLARSHLGCCWTQSSTEKDEIQLKECTLAYQQALRFVDNVTDPLIWYESAIAHMMVGSLEGAAQMCTQLLVEFPAFEHVVSVIHSAGMLLMHLGKTGKSDDDGNTSPDVAMLERAVSYFSHISKSQLEPYTIYHYDFIIARIKDVIEGGSMSWEGKTELYSKLFEEIKADENVLQDLENEVDPWCIAETESVAQWLENEMLWWNFGAFCAGQSHYLLAIEFFRVAVIISNNANADLLCWLADAHLGCGPSFKDEAKLLVVEALKLDPESEFARTVFDFVNDPPQSVFEAQTQIPLRELILPLQEAEEAAASKMQGLFRLKKANQKVADKKQAEEKKHTGATKFQSVFRGKRGRRRASDVRVRIRFDNEKEAENTRRHKGATQLQKLARAKKAKKGVLRKREEKQEIARKKNLALQAAAEERARQDHSAIKVQTIVRGKRGRNEVTRRKKAKVESELAASTIQKCVRGKKARAGVAAMKADKEEQGNAACKIQSAFRAKKGRKRVRRKRARKEKALLKSQKELEESQQGLHNSFGFSSSKEISDDPSLRFRNQMTRLKDQTDSFLEVENSPFETQKLKSLKKLKRHGFPSTVVTSTYIRHWESLLTALSCIFPEQKIIRRKAAEVVSLSPGFTEDEALCALAACYGVVGEAVGRLRNENFKHESMSICSILDIQSYVFKRENMNTSTLGSPNSSIFTSGFSLSSPTSPYKRRGLTAMKWSHSHSPNMNTSISAPNLGLRSRKGVKTCGDEKIPRKKTFKAQQRWCSKACSGKTKQIRRRDIDSMIESCMDIKRGFSPNQDLCDDGRNAFIEPLVLPSIDHRQSSPPRSTRVRSPDDELRLFSPLQLTQTSYENATTFTR